jgi:hypothetical protein
MTIRRWKFSQYKVCQDCFRPISFFMEQVTLVQIKILTKSHSKRYIFLYIEITMDVDVFKSSFIKYNHNFVWVRSKHSSKYIYMIKNGNLLLV